MIVKVYSTINCPFCHSLKSWLTENKIEFINYDVGSDEVAREEMIKISKQMTVPVTTIDGEGIIIGFDIEKFKEIFNIK